MIAPVAGGHHHVIGRDPLRRSRTRRGGPAHVVAWRGMARKGRHSRNGGRVTPKGTRPRGMSPGFQPLSAVPSAPRDPELMATVRRALHTPGPLPLLELVSTMMSLVDPRDADPFARDESARSTIHDLVQPFRGTVRPETTAALAVIAELTPDPLLQADLRDVVAARGHRLPAWLGGLGDTTVTGVVEMVHVLGDGDDVIVGVRVPPDHELTAVVFIDHNLGSVAKDAFMVPEGLDALVDQMRRLNDDPDTEWRALDRADARAWLVEGIDSGARTWPPFESDTWPSRRPLVEWITRLLPTGGTGRAWREWTADERDALAAAFLAAPFGARHDSADGREMLDALLWYGTDYGTGDPLRWSPVSVEIVLADWIARKIMAPLRTLQRGPDVLRDLIRYGHAELGIRPALTDETLAAVDRWEPGYQALISDDTRPQGVDALFEAVGLRDRDRDGVAPAVGAADDGVDALGSHEYWAGLDAEVAGIMLDRLSTQAGGRDALFALTEDPLPEEPWPLPPAVPEDIAPAVAEVAALCGDWLRGLPDPELGAACRQLLARVVTGDPDIFRRRASMEGTAAALCWAVGQAHDLFGAGGLRVKDLATHFGVSGSPASRARTLLRAAGLPQEPYGPVRLAPDMLTSSRRRWLISTRDRYLDDL